jgi:hypothetical protein
MMWRWTTGLKTLALGANTNATEGVYQRLTAAPPHQMKLGGAGAQPTYAYSAVGTRHTTHDGAYCRPGIHTHPYVSLQTHRP